MLCTWPVRKEQLNSIERRVILNEDGTLKHLKQPEYHGNPVSDDGPLVTVDYAMKCTSSLLNGRRSISASLASPTRRMASWVNTRKYSSARSQRRQSKPTGKHPPPHH